MKTKLLICCEMIRKEMTAILKDIPFEGDIIWMEKGLHEHPENLRAALQEEIGKWDGCYETILLGYGMCGNGVCGLKAERSQLIIPKFDDCIRFLLSREERAPILSDPRTLYYTDGWMDMGDSLLSPQSKYFEQYGEKKGFKIIKMMLANYKSVTFLETGYYDMTACEEEVRPMADRLGLEVKRTPACLRMLQKLLTGPYDDEFVSLAPGETLAMTHFDDRARCLFPERD